MLLNLVFAGNVILSCLFFFFLIIDLYLLIAAVTGEIFNTIAEFVIPIGAPNKEAKADIERHPVIAETKKNVDYNLKL